MKKLLFFIVILGAVGVYLYYFMPKQKDNKPKFKTEQISKGYIQASVSATGTLNAVTTVLIGTQVSGTIKALYVDFNTKVKAGQLIAQIDPSTVLAQVDQAEANLLAAKANVEKAEASLLEAKRAMDRTNELYLRNLIARSDFDTSETNYKSAKAQLSVNKAQVKQTEASLKLAETNLKYTNILSPVDGIVISRSVDIGQTVAASFQTPTLFTIAQDLTKMQIDTNVDEADIGKIILNQPVEFTVDAYPDFTFKGSVSQIRNAPITVQNVVTYDVVIAVQNLDLKLKPGMTANVSIIISTKENVLKIPNAALRFKPAENSFNNEKKKSKNKDQEFKGKSLWILENGKPKRIKIKTGISDGNYTEIISDELKEDEEIIVESLTKPKVIPTGGGPRFL